MLEDSERRGALLGLVLMKKEGLFGDVKAGGSLGCNDHQMVQFRSMLEVEWL